MVGNNKLLGMSKNEMARQKVMKFGSLAEGRSPRTCLGFRVWVWGASYLDSARYQ